MAKAAVKRRPNAKTRKQVSKPKLRISDHEVDFIINNPEQVGQELQTKVFEATKLLDVKVSQLKEDEELYKLITELRQTYAKLDPNSVKSSFLGKILAFIGLSEKLTAKISLKAETLKDQINVIQQQLAKRKDDLYYANAELENMVNEFNQMLSKLNELIEKMQIVHDSIKDDENYKDKAVVVLKRLQSLYAMKNVLLQSIESAKQIVKTNKLLIESIQDMLFIAPAALSAALSIHVALNTQKKAITFTNATKDFVNNMIANNAKQLSKQVDESKDLYQSSVVDIQTLENSFKTLKAAFDKLDKIKEESVKVMQQNIKRLHKLSQETEQFVSSKKGVKDASKSIPESLR